MPNQVVVLTLPPLEPEGRWDVVTVADCASLEVWSGANAVDVFAQVAAAYDCQRIGDPLLPESARPLGFDLAERFPTEFALLHAQLAMLKQAGRDLRDAEVFQRFEVFANEMQRLFGADPAFDALLQGARIAFTAFEGADGPELQTYEVALVDKRLRVRAGERTRTLGFAPCAPWVERSVREAYGWPGVPLWDEELEVRDWCVIAQTLQRVEVGVRELIAAPLVRRVYTTDDFEPNWSTRITSWPPGRDDDRPLPFVRGTVQGGDGFDDAVQLIELGAPEPSAWHRTRIDGRLFATNGVEQVWDEQAAAVESIAPGPPPHWVSARGAAAALGERWGAVETDAVELLLNAITHLLTDILINDLGEQADRLLGGARCSWSDGRAAELELGFVPQESGAVAALSCVFADARPPIRIEIARSDGDPLAEALLEGLSLDLLPTLTPVPEHHTLTELAAGLYTLAVARSKGRSQPRRRRFRAASFELEVAAQPAVTV